MILDNVVPWGRSFDEYASMFDLTELDLQKRILGCGDGPASFNAELTERGGSIVSVDPIYNFTVSQIQARIDEVYPQVLNQMEKNTQDYLWENIKNVSELGRIRMKAMQRFLSDYEKGLAEKRYHCAALPQLAFKDKAFDLALCSHFLFLYSDHLNFEQHLQSIKELCRVATEVRIYPLMSLDGKLSEHLVPVINELKEDGIKTSIQKVEYRFQKGATDMLVLNAI